MYHVVRGAIRGICENSFMWLLKVALNRQIAKIQRPKHQRSEVCQTLHKLYSEPSSTSEGSLEATLGQSYKIQSTEPK